MLSNWKRIYRKRIRPEFENDPNRKYSLLDIGFGGGDIPLSIARWANQDGFKLEITAIETDQRAFEYAQNLCDNSSFVTFLNCSSSDLIKQEKHFDIVVSNHVLHHLDKSSTFNILDETKHLATSLVIFNDIERSDIGYFLFNVFSRLLFRNSFITEDGLTSIKRCYTKRELAEIAPYGWKVERSFPFRLLLSYEN